ncbi:hypothetical protein [Asticcacaulis sp. 201]|uniref:hypothetical protein n=1 Tax=Asticcacaulis sp. 201 TaxID=3028787 RepID=UPI002916550F|nr:hypothetical protein [Asticcacaulis sp. 201]MDV6329401.1 hypothetical protein [Asticcacaulis sp. 201]
MTIAQRLLIPAATVLLLAGAAQAQTQPSTPATVPSPSVNIGDMPKWSEFPVPPAHVPTPAEIRRNVGETDAKGRQLGMEIRALVWDNNNPEAFAANALNRLDQNFSKPIEGALSPAEINALGADLRRRAAPPPIAN